MFRLIRRLFFLFFISCVCSFVLFVFFYARFTSPGPLNLTKDIIITKGANVNQIADILAEFNVIRDTLTFKLGVFFSGQSSQLKAGEYRFKPEVSNYEVMQKITSGKTVQRRLTIAEGLTVSEIIKIINATEGLEGKLTEIPIEGSLLPETYYFSYGDKRQMILSRMKKAMEEAVNNLWQTKSPSLPIKSKDEALILASIIEKETSVPSERPRTAAVFINRLNKGMKLQSDPTVIYGITKGEYKLGRPLSKRDLEQENKFNTYYIHGLPPTPITNPGIDSLKAALQPLKSNELYFVADGQGGHVFATTLDEHNKNVAKLRALEAEKKEKLEQEKSDDQNDSSGETVTNSE